MEMKTQMLLEGGEIQQKWKAESIRTAWENAHEIKVPLNMWPRVFTAMLQLKLSTFRQQPKFLSYICIYAYICISQTSVSSWNSNTSLLKNRPGCWLLSPPFRPVLTTQTSMLMGNPWGPATFVSSRKRMSLSGRLGDSHQAAGNWTSSVLADSHLSSPEVDQQVARPWRVPDGQKIGALKDCGWECGEGVVVQQVGCVNKDPKDSSSTGMRLLLLS